MNECPICPQPDVIACCHFDDDCVALSRQDDQQVAHGKSRFRVLERGRTRDGIAIVGAIYLDTNNENEAWITFNRQRDALLNSPGTPQDAREPS